MVRGGGKSQAPAERVQKILAALGLASRREAEEWIRAGRVTVNGRVAELGARARPHDQIRLDGRLVRRRAAQSAPVFLCHRSPGEPLAAILERLPRRAGKRFIAVSPMPQVDGALEIVTADGALAAKLQRTVRGMPSEFSARVRGELTATQLGGILHGELDRGARLTVEKCDPAGGEGTNRWYDIVARGASGKDVRQLLERQGALVSRVLRTRLGTLALDRNVARGQFRELTPEELAALLAIEAAARGAAAARPE
ncbi:MAG TPA: S4 domain-containing protein [Steroidobacteraceae bacterium]|nr:S4 domain-containing protein [Steroidobacteraceae bacterium]